MFDNISFQKEKRLFSIVNKQYEAAHNEHHLYCRPQDLINWVQVIKEDLNYIYFIDVVALRNPSNTPFDFELDIIVANLESHQRLHLHVQFYKGEVIPSIANFYPSSLYALREQRDLFDIKFDMALESLFLTEKNRNIFSSDWEQKEEAKTFKPPKLPYNPNKSESPYPQESWRWAHGDLFSKKTLGKFEAYYCFDPFKVVDVKTRLGSKFRGVELELTKKDHSHIAYLLEHMNHFASPFYSSAWVINLEQILELEITERAKGLRIVLWELSRIAEHLFVTYEMCHLLELNESLFYLDAYERVCELFEAFSGNRYGQGVIKVGGLSFDIPAGWIIEFQEFNKIFLKNITLYHQYLLANS
ncbi:MAG: NADH-quinone oxidoreductase subunit C, partial [Bacteriovoracaceae bacterium]